MSGRWSNYNHYNQWPAYVPVAERRARAERQIAKLSKKGEAVQPIKIEGRAIARSFWGKGWCAHLESFGDYSNRLPRGRSYVRNGSVCHLGIERGRVEALVAGSRLYRVNVEVTRLTARKWTHLKQRCTGRIGSLIELLQGKLSDEIMGTVTDRDQGLFPLPGEIKYTCNCPDWADMCKHVSAVMYGIGARLDERPELLFLLRGVDHEELIAAHGVGEALAGTGSRRTRRRALSESAAAKMFGVELDETEAPPSADRPAREAPAKTPATRRRVSGGKTAKTKATSKSKSSSAGRSPFKPTGAAVAKLRKSLSLGRAAFARAVGVSAATVANWEKSRGTLQLQAKGLRGLRRLHAQDSPRKARP
jgi:uncharacterized Zn finger protein